MNAELRRGPPGPVDDDVRRQRAAANVPHFAPRSSAQVGSTKATSAGEAAPDFAAC
jgi:hypothetical protein